MSAAVGHTLEEVIEAARKAVELPEKREPRVLLILAYKAPSGLDRLMQFHVDVEPQERVRILRKALAEAIFELEPRP